MSCSVRVLAVIFFAFILSADSLCKAEEGISSDSPGVMNLSGYLRGNQLLFQEYVPLKIDVLDFGAAELMIRAPQLSWNDREVIKWEKLAPKDEKKRIADDKNTVSRAGKSLVIKPESAPPITFKDWYLSGGDQEEGDRQSFFYLGKLALNGFYRVEAFYQHDSPGSFFINPKNGRILYAHNGTDIVALSPNGKRMVVINDGLNPPFGLVVANMSLDNPVPELYCRSRSTQYPRTITPVFKGWRGADRFDLVLILQNKLSETMPTFLAIPIRFSLKDDSWHVSASNIVDLDRVAGLSCSQRPNTSK